MWDKTRTMVKEWPNSCREVTDYIDELEVSYAALECDAAMIEAERDFYKKQYRQAMAEIKRKDKERGVE